jgi:hypothetical protein
MMTPSAVCFLTISAPHSRQVLLSMAASSGDVVLFNSFCQKDGRFYTLKLKSWINATGYESRPCLLMAPAPAQAL